jgi:hypothetical protein
MDYQKLSTRTTDHYSGENENFRITGNVERGNGQIRVYGELFAKGTNNGIGNFNYDSGALNCNLYAGDYVAAVTAINQFVTDMINGIEQ